MGPGIAILSVVNQGEVNPGLEGREGRKLKVLTSFNYFAEKTTGVYFPIRFYTKIIITH